MKNQLLNHPIQPVLMIPLRRCGSHAIRLRLSFSPDFYSPYPLHLVDFAPLLPLYGDLDDDARYLQLVVDIVGLQALSLVTWDGVTINPVQLFEKIKDRPRSAHTVAWEILCEAARSRGARVVMDKSLDNVHQWRDILGLYPNMRFLNVVRDPRAQVSSMNRAIIHEFDSLLNAQILVRAYEAAQELIQAYPEHVLTVRFEDFIMDEGRTTRKICDFLGVRYVPEMSDITHSEEAMRMSRQSALWESNGSSPIKANVDKFKGVLSAEEIELIETLTKGVMDHYRYARMTEANAQVTEKMFTQAWERSDKRKKQAWDDLKASKPQDYLLRKRRADYIEMCRRNLIGTLARSNDRPAVCANHS
jgi:hypothetical protein